MTEHIRLAKRVAEQLSCSRSTAEQFIEGGFVSVDGRVVEAPGARVRPDQGVAVAPDASPLALTPVTLLLHKPAGYECSQRPGAWPGVHTLLPAPLRQRPGGGKSPGVQAVGRLDQDTTGLLLLSDDGAFIHRMNSPRRHVPKVYEVTTRHPLDAAQVGCLLAGVVLDDDPRPVRAAAALAVAERHLQLTLTEGKYHQVKRMVAAVGNRVEALHRSRVGGLALPADLAPGQWRWLDEGDLALLAPPPA